MSITEVSLGEFFFTAGRFIEALDYNLPHFKLVAEVASPHFGRLVELVEALSTSVKNTLELGDFSEDVARQIEPDIAKLTRVLDGVKTLVSNRQTPITEENIQQLLNS